MKVFGYTCQNADEAAFLLTWKGIQAACRAANEAIGDEREGPDADELLTGDAYWDEQERLAGMLNGEAA